MNIRAVSKPITISISAVERDTGLSKDTLRAWERRYGFPTPDRDGFGERAYPLEQVEKLRVLRRLIDAGHRPGRIVKLSTEDLQIISEGVVSPPQRLATDDGSTLRALMALIKSHDVDGLKRSLSQATLRMGLARFVVDLVAPMNAMIGDAWIRGQLEVFEEHMYTESVAGVMRGALSGLPDSGHLGSPRVLLTTFPQEPHGLGLLMAETLLALEGAKCLSLGAQTPIWDIVLAATAHKSDVVALSFTASLNPNYVTNGLIELRAKLPAHMEIWAGGQCPAIHRRAVPGIVVISDLSGIEPEIARWHATRA